MLGKDLCPDLIFDFSQGKLSRLLTLSTLHYLQMGKPTAPPSLDLRPAFPAHVPEAQCRDPKAQTAGACPCSPASQEDGPTTWP